MVAVFNQVDGFLSRWHRKLPPERTVKAGRNACGILNTTYINILADKESVEFQSSFLG